MSTRNKKISREPKKHSTKKFLQHFFKIAWKRRLNYRKRREVRRKLIDWYVLEKNVSYTARIIRISCNSIQILRHSREIRFNRLFRDKIILSRLWSPTRGIAIVRITRLSTLFTILKDIFANRCSVRAFPVYEAIPQLVERSRANKRDERSHNAWNKEKRKFTTLSVSTNDQGIFVPFEEAETDKKKCIEVDSSRFRTFEITTFDYCCRILHILFYLTEFDFYIGKMNRVEELIGNFFTWEELGCFATRKITVD